MAIDPLTGLPRARGTNTGAVPNYRAAGFGPPSQGDLPQGSYSLSPNVNTGYQPSSASFLGFTPTTTPGTAPDYKSLILNDPIYKQLGLDLSAQGITDASGRAAATQKALVNFGFAPDTTNALGLNQSYLQSDITPEVRLAAQNNKLSISQRIKDAYQKNLNDLRVQLRQRGASRSGEQGYQQQQALNAYDTANYDAGQSLTDYWQGVQAAFARGEQQRQAQLAAAQADAAARQAALNPASPDTTTSIAMPPLDIGPGYAAALPKAVAAAGGSPVPVAKAPVKKKPVQPLLHAR